jgi:hypothetical protein
MSKRCGCAADACSCYLSAGAGANVTGGGTKTNPYVLSGVTGIAVVRHGGNPSLARPASPVVYWVGTATPLNAQPYDFWEAANL